MDRTEEQQAQHTPGPWVVQSDDTGPTIMLDSGLVLAELPGTTEAKANARLIAAAPELLDVLQQYTANDDALEAGLRFNDYTKEYNRIFALAKAAIAKATGGQS